MNFFVNVLFGIFIGIIIEGRLEIVGGTSRNDYITIVGENSNSSISYAKNCTPAEIDTVAGCTLVCNASCTGNVKETKTGWIYKAFKNSTDYYPIVYGTSGNYSKDSYYLSLTLKDYRSGFYIAQFSCDDTILNATFSISGTEGILLGAPCNNSRNCSTLNAVCGTKGCECSGDNPVPKTNNPDASSCLPLVTTGGECMVDDQCEDDNTALFCRKPNKDQSDFGICSCLQATYFVRYVNEKDKMMCIQPEGYYDDCDYDEECDFVDQHMECNSYGYCDCEYGYYFDYYYMRCEYNPWTAYLSVTAVIGIVFGVIFLVILIMVGFALCLRPQMFRRNRPPPVPPSTIDNQFNSFTEPTVMWSAGTRYPMDGLPNYAEAGGLETPPPPFESDVVIKTRLEDPPVENSNPFQQVDLNQPSQVQQQHLDLYTPQSTPSQTQQQVDTSPDTREQFNTNEMFFFQNPNYQTNMGFEEDC